MKPIQRGTSGRGNLFALFRLLARFTNHRMASSGRGMETFSPSWCLSTQLRWSSWCPQLVQKGGHGSSHLRQCRHRASGFPRLVSPFQQWARQDQLIVRTSHHLRPTLGTLRGTHPWTIPEQFLFVEAITMLVRVAQPIRRTDLGQRSRFVAFPDKPTDGCRSRALPLAP